MIGHALKFPYSQIHGLLLGKLDESNRVLTIHDAIAVCHSAPTKPIVDMAVRITEVHLESLEELKRLKIVGWYTANERSEDETPRHAALKIASELSDHCMHTYEGGGEVVLVSVLSKGIVDMFASAVPSKDTTVFKVYGKDSTRKQWSREYSSNQVSFHSHARLASAILSISSETKDATVNFHDFEIWKRFLEM